MAQLFPPPPATPQSRFVSECRRACGEQRSEQFCALYCVCMADELQANKALDFTTGSAQTQAQKDAVQDTIMLCTFRTEDALPEESAP